jgi:hypothetical protein
MSNTKCDIEKASCTGYEAIMAPNMAGKSIGSHNSFLFLRYRRIVAAMGNMYPKNTPVIDVSIHNNIKR